MDTKSIQLILENDPKLKGVIDHIRPIVWKSTKNVFHDLMSCVIEQQIHYRSKKKSFARMLEKADIDLLTLDNFEKFEALGLRDVKLNARKYATIAHLLEFFEEVNVDWLALEDDEVCDQLSLIKGVGPWTVDMILLYTLERPDIFPVDDYHLKKVMTEVYHLDPKRALKKQLRQIASEWKPFRSLGTLSLLAWKEQSGKNAIK